ncbi:MAG: N-acetylmuramic acid 6-phosphate etherase [Erysipelothrix sp.]|nr:N-acetylmuramic acid 6-phosphate etherase [Erysipelothrix sp.]
METKISSLDTEKRNINTMDLDTLDTIGILEKINNEDQKVALAVKGAMGNITALVDAAYEAYINGGRIVYIGAGTSGRLGVLDASECPPTYGTNPEDVVAFIAGGERALLKAVEGAEDSEELAVEDLKSINLNEKDIVVGLAASGRTPYVMGGLNYANSINAKTGSIACTQNSLLATAATYPVEVVVGPEAVTGSTRMKAGTAQKLVLNMLTTTVMVKAGKVYENLMVDVQTTNIKLVNRAARIVSEAVGVSEEDAHQLLEKANMDVKIAILIGITDQSVEDAQVMLNNHAGNVSKTIRELK